MAADRAAGSGPRRAGPALRRAAAGERAAASARAEARRRLVLAVRDACRAAAAAAWEEAQSAGICADGALEVALGAISRLTAEDLLAAAERDAER